MTLIVTSQTTYNSSFVCRLAEKPIDYLKILPGTSYERVNETKTHMDKSSQILEARIKPQRITDLGERAAKGREGGGKAGLARG